MKKTYEKCQKCGKKGLYLSNGYPDWGDGTKRCRYCGHIVPPGPAHTPDHPADDDLGPAHTPDGPV